MKIRLALVGTALAGMFGAAHADTISLVNPNAPGTLVITSPATASPVLGTTSWVFRLNRTGTAGQAIVALVNYDETKFTATVQGRNGVTCAVSAGTQLGFSGDISGLSDGDDLCRVQFTVVNAAANASDSPVLTMSSDNPAGSVTLNPFTVTYTLGPPTDPVGTVADPADFLAATSLPGSTTTTGAINAVGGANGGSSEVSCVSDDPQITVTSLPNPATCNDANVCTPAAIEFTCAATTAAQTANITCTSDGPNSTPVVQAAFAVNCPAANVDPTINSTTPAYGAAGGAVEITFGQVGVGQPSTQNVTVAASGGSGSGTASYTCSASAGFSVTGSPVNFAGTQTAGAFDVVCDAAPAVGAGATTGTLTCTEIDADSAGPAGTSRVYDLSCPEGVPRSAPTVAYSAAPGFNTGASVGATATSTANFTADLSGGQDDSAGGAESASVECSVTSGAFAIVGSGGPVSANSPAGAPTPDLSFAMTCSTPANAAAAGVLSCDYTPTVDGTAGTTVTTDFDLSCPPAPANLSSNPATGAITLTGTPATTLNGAITFNNIGSDATLACTATAGTANVTIVGNPVAVAANGSAQLTYTCLAGNSGTPNTGSISCATNDPDTNPMVYNITCAGLVSAPIPAVNDFGKLLMVVLVIGLGLVGLGARRQ